MHQIETKDYGTYNEYHHGGSIGMVCQRSQDHVHLTNGWLSKFKRVGLSWGVREAVSRSTEVPARGDGTRVSFRVS